MDTHPRFPEPGLVADVPCPLCYGFRFQFLLRCDLGLDTCLPVLRCQKCGHTIALEGGTARRLRDASLHKPAGRCPYCGSGATRLVLACDIRHRRTFVTGECQDCRGSFSM